MRKNQFLVLAIVLCIVLLLVLLFFIFIVPSVTTNVIKEPYSEIEVYFCPLDMCKEKILELASSSTEIKCAFYDLDLPDLIYKLKQKNAEVVIEDSNKLDSFYTGYSFALMHNKFCVFDRKVVITGSMNPTENDNFYNNNNIIIIKSSALAENYLYEFYELKNNIYGKGNKVKNPVIYLGTTGLENYFCPEDNCKLHVLNALKKANKSIYFMTFSFTDEDIGNLVWNKHYIGLDVKGIFDDGQISDYSRYNDLKEFSIIDKNKYKLHHKVFIIDNETVITGSFNPSSNANERNDENVLIINDRKIAKKYAEEFKRLYYYEEKMPESVTDLIMSKVVYDADGKDEGNEFVELKNVGDKEIVLDYYFLSDNKTNTRLNGTIKPNHVVRFMPKFALKNTNGILLLKHNNEIIDFAFWEGLWSLQAKNGRMLVRKNPNMIDEKAWDSD